MKAWQTLFGALFGILCEQRYHAPFSKKEDSFSPSRLLLRCAMSSVVLSCSIRWLQFVRHGGLHTPDTAGGRIAGWLSLIRNCKFSWLIFRWAESGDWRLQVHQVTWRHVGPRVLALLSSWMQGHCGDRGRSGGARPHPSHPSAAHPRRVLLHHHRRRRRLLSSSSSSSNREINFFYVGFLTDDHVSRQLQGPPDRETADYDDGDAGKETELWWRQWLWRQSTSAEAATTR